MVSLWSPWHSLRSDSKAPGSGSGSREGSASGAGGEQALLTASRSQVTMTKPSAPVVTFGIKHSDYMTPLVVDVE